MSYAYQIAGSPGAPCAILQRAISSHGVRQSFERNAELYAQDEVVDRIFEVVSGMVRTTRFGPDGRRQIGDFYGPGDLFGLETGWAHRFTAEALSDCEVRSVRRVHARALAGERELDLAILEATRRELERAQSHMWMLGLKNAREKVGAFLAALAQNAGAGFCDLPMSRQDMADYLGLTLETVSRMLSQLQADAVVEFASSRAFRIRDWTPLDRIAA